MLTVFYVIYPSLHVISLHVLLIHVLSLHVLSFHVVLIHVLLIQSMFYQSSPVITCPKNHDHAKYCEISQTDTVDRAKVTTLPRESDVLSIWHGR